MVHSILNPMFKCFKPISDQNCLTKQSKQVLCSAEDVLVFEMLGLTVRVPHNQRFDFRDSASQSQHPLCLSGISEIPQLDI